MTRRPTLEDVAALAGVGRGTASRVINRQAKVSPQAREAVEAAIAELGYIPNRAARSLVTRRTDAVALVIAESEERVFGEPFFAGVIRGIGAALADAGKQLVLVLAPSDRPGHLDDFLTRQHVDGVLLLSLHADDTMPQRLHARGLRVVQGGGPAPAPGVGCVDNDNVGGAHQAVAHLAARGRTRIAAIAGPSDMPTARDRLAGYRAALEEAGLPADDGLVEHGNFREPSGEEAMAVLLGRRPDLDAVFAANDLMATGAMKVLRAWGREIPRDVAVVGFEDSALSRSTQPPLTTVHQSPEGMGRVMVEMLLSEIADAAYDPGVRLLPTYLVERASS